MPLRHPEQGLRILHIIPSLGVGGAERQLAQLLVRMDSRRFKQTVCFYTPSETFEAELTAVGIQVVFFNKFSMPWWSFFTRLRRVVRDVAPDVVHTWLASGNFWGRLVALTCGVRRLIASHRSMATAPSLPVYLSEKLFAPFTVCVANSRAVAASLERHYGLPMERTRIIYNAVDLQRRDQRNARAAVRSELGVPHGQKLVLLAGRQAPEKNHAMYFRVARRVAERRPDVTFVALGYMFRPNDLYALLEAHGASACVRLLEQTDDLSRWLAAADLFCLTSNREGLPNVVLEAMAGGLPVVCSDFESAREVIADPSVGVIVPRDDDAAMAEVVLRLIDDPEHARALAVAARKRVETHFAWERLVKEMESLYKSVVSGEVGPRHPNRRRVGAPERKRA